MRVLDLDMDFFLTGVCELAPRGARPSLREARPWAEADVRAFLEENCGLSRQTPIPGRVFETHDGALFFWKEWLEAGKTFSAVPRHPRGRAFRPRHRQTWPRLRVGNGAGSAPQKRGDLSRYVREEKLDEANYLLFALALRYISSLENVRNPHSRADFPARLAVDGSQPPTAIRLSSTLARLLPQYDFAEPVIPYKSYDDFRSFRVAAPYDFASLAISPRYAPREADFIADALSQSITEV